MLQEGGFRSDYAKLYQFKAMTHSYKKIESSAFDPAVRALETVT